MKRQFVSLSVASLLVVAAWFGLAYRPAHSQLRELRDEVSTTKQQVTDLEAKLRQLLALQRNSSGARDQAQRLMGSLPADPKVSDFILQVQDAANSAGIDFLSIAPSLPAVPADIAASTAPAPSADGSTAAASPTPEEAAAAAAAAAANPATRLRAISVQIKADGEYFEIEDFVLKMERLARALRIDDFSLSAAGEDQTGGKLSASMKVQMFMLAPQAAAGAVPNGQTTQGTSEAA